MKPSVTRIALLSALLCTAASLGQENAPPPPATRPPPAATSPAEAGRDAEPAATPPAGESRAAPDDEFIPTEELAPDAAVTFPVDI